MATNFTRSFRGKIRSANMGTISTILLTDDQSEHLRSLLEEKGFDEKKVPYARYSFARPGLTVTVYEKGNKLLIQGKDAEEWVEFTLEPMILGQSMFSQTSGATPTAAKAEACSPHFGIDESGKGDYFGPLVIAGVYVNEEIGQRLLALGACDSKLVSSSAKIRSLAVAIRKVPGIEYVVVSVGPERYNELYEHFKNLNTFLAWGHTRVIAGLLEKVPTCPRALSDQFAHASVLKKALAQRQLAIKLDQRTKAESDVAVAAASILARERFINWMDDASKAGKVKLPLGASRQVIDAAKKLVSVHGEEMLPKVAKMHFKTTQSVLPNR